MLKSEQVLLQKGQGNHWVELAEEVLRHQVSDKDLRSIALGYPDRIADLKTRRISLSFHFLIFILPIAKLPPILVAKFKD